jgi:hypothetical protein
MPFYVSNLTNGQRGVAVNNGDTLYVDEQPKLLNGQPNWTLEYYSPTHQGKTRFIYSVNGKPIQQDWSDPYSIKNFVFSPGKYTVEYLDSPNGIGTMQPFSFTVQQSRPVAPSNQIGTGAMGTNFVGADYANGDPTLHPAQPAAMKSLKMTIGRRWLELGTLADKGDAYWNINRACKAQGFKNGLQIQMPDNKMMFTDFGLSMAKQVIAGKAVDVVFSGNEFNTYHTDSAGHFDVNNPGNYYGGGDANATKYCETIYQPFADAGITTVAPSRVNDLPGVQSRAKSGAYGPIKEIDLHLYSDNEGWMISQVQEFDAFCKANGFNGWISEWNLRMHKGETLSDWGVRIQKVLAAIKATSLTALHFSLIPTQHEDDTTATLDAHDQPLSLPIFKAVLNP